MKIHESGITHQHEETHISLTRIGFDNLKKIVDNFHVCNATRLLSNFSRSPSTTQIHKKKIEIIIRCFNYNLIFRGLQNQRNPVLNFKNDEKVQTVQFILCKMRKNIEGSESS